MLQLLRHATILPKKYADPATATKLATMASLEPTCGITCLSTTFHELRHVNWTERAWIATESSQRERGKPSSSSSGSSAVFYSLHTWMIHQMESITATSSKVDATRQAKTTHVNADTASLQLLLHVADARFQYPCADSHVL